jgi:L-iditol 2-dehydrogenase
MSSMTAVIFEAREQMRVVSVPRPVCGPGDVLLRVAACGICGSDARSFFQGDQHGRRIPGHEVTGVIEAAGRDVKGWKEGERVALAADVHCGTCWYCRNRLLNMCQTLRTLGKHMDGGMAEYFLLTPEILERGVVNRVPPGVGLLDAALSEPLCSVLASHDELAIQAGETVAVFGCGPMGILHLELLRARGARVAMIDISASRVALARERFAARPAIDARQEDAAGVVREWAGEAGADAAIVAAPSPEAVGQAVGLIRKRGRVGLFGGLPAASAQVALDINRIHYGEMRLIGNFSYDPGYHPRALELLASGRLPADRLITTYPIEETRRGLEDIRQGKVLKAVVIPREAGGAEGTPAGA